MNRLCLFVFFILLCSIEAQLIREIAVTAETPKEACRKALQEYLERIVALPVLNDFPQLFERRKNMLEDPLPFIQECQFQEKGCSLVKVKSLETLQFFLMNSEVVRKAFPHNIGIVGENAKKESKLLQNFGFRLIEISPWEQKRLQETVKDKKDRAIWMKDNHLQIVLQITPGGEGNIFNLLGRVYSDFTKEEAIESFLQQIFKWRIDQEFFLRFLDFPDNAVIEDSLGNLQSQGILEYQSMYVSKKEYLVDCTCKNQRSIIALLQERLPQHERYLLSSRVIEYHYSNSRFYLWLSLMLVSLAGILAGGIFLRHKKSILSSSPARQTKIKPDWIVCDMYCPHCDQQVSWEAWERKEAIKVANTFYHKSCLVESPILSSSIDGWKLLCVLGQNSFGDYYAVSKGEEIAVLHKLPCIRPEHKDPEQWKRMIERLRRGFQYASEAASQYPKDVILPGEIIESKNCYYYLMPYYPAWTLKQVLGKTKGNFPPQALSYVMAWLSHILANLHSNKIVHRDIKPANILWGIDGTLRLTGFCLLKHSKKYRSTDTVTEDMAVEMLSQNESYNITVPGKFLGTPAYSSPEQIKNAIEASPKSDIWALGVVALELLTKTNPFDKGNDLQLSLRQVRSYQGIGDIYRLTKDLPEAWKKILEKTLVTEPKERLNAIEIERIIQDINFRQ